jgi:hypothetical protein
VVWATSNLLMQYAYVSRSISVFESIHLELLAFSSFPGTKSPKIETLPRGQTKRYFNSDSATLCVVKFGKLYHGMQVATTLTLGT